jgi:aminopeptidase YwaD
MKKILLAVVLAMLALSVALAQVEEKPLTTDAAITAEEFIENIKYLASENLGGRGNGDAGLLKAAEAIRANFRAAGLQPLADDFFQYFDIQIGNDFGAGNLVSLTLGGETIELKLADDFAPLAYGKESVKDLEVVFAGYGISAAEKKYDDYAMLDVKDKLLLIFDFEPQRDNKDSVFDGTVDTQYAQMQSKIMTARAKGAAGMIVITGPLHRDPDVPEIPKIMPGYVVQPIGIPTVKVKYDSIAAFLEASGLHPEAVQKEIDEKLITKSRKLPGLTASISLEIKPKMARVPNVVGFLAGSDEKLKDEYIVIGAHYDHLGAGYSGSMTPGRIGEIHNGADDNASGTSGLLELAEALAAADIKPRRSVIFIAFAGEEMGLLGSTHYVTNPLISLDKTAAMLNLDMIGRVNNSSLTIGGVGTAAGLREITEKALESYSFKASLQDSGFASSDNAAFVGKSIPALFFFSGTHKQYHSPDDDWDLINIEEGAEVIKLVRDITIEVAAMDSKPEFISIASAAPKNRRAGNGSWFGSMPDFSYQGEGYRFQAVSAGSPAEKAGLLGGDTMIEFAGVEVGNIYDYTAVLGNYKPGDTVKVKVLREGKELSFEVTLARRK